MRSEQTLSAPSVAASTFKPETVSSSPIPNQATDLGLFTPDWNFIVPRRGAMAERYNQCSRAEQGAHEVDEVRLERLSKEYNRAIAVDNVSLTIEPGSMIALLVERMRKDDLPSMIAGLSVRHPATSSSTMRG